MRGRSFAVSRASLTAMLICYTAATSPRSDIEMYRSREGSCGLDTSGSGYGPVKRFCKHGNEPSGSTKGGEFLD